MPESLPLAGYEIPVKGLDGSVRQGTHQDTHALVAQFSVVSPPPSGQVGSDGGISRGTKQDYEHPALGFTDANSTKRHRTLAHSPAHGRQ